MHDMSRSDARRALTWYEVIPVKGEASGKYSRGSVFSGRGAGGGKLRVREVRGVWRTNGLRIRNRPVVLSNFHVENNLIRVTD